MDVVFETIRYAKRNVYMTPNDEKSQMLHEALQGIEHLVEGMEIPRRRARRDPARRVWGQTSTWSADSDLLTAALYAGAYGNKERVALVTNDHGIHGVWRAFEKYMRCPSERLVQCPDFREELKGNLGKVVLQGGLHTYADYQGAGVYTEQKQNRHLKRMRLSTATWANGSVLLERAFMHEKKMAEREHR